MRKLVACLVMMGLLAGCGAQAREMGDTALLRVMALDGTADGVDLALSAGTGDGAPLSATGRTVSSAAREVQRLGDSQVYFGHVDQLVISEGTAVEGISPVLDFLAREEQLGLDVDLWVARGVSAAQAVTVPEAAKRLERLARDGGLRRTALEVMSILARGGSTCLPVLELREGGLVRAGYAVLREGRLVCCTDEEAARGTELLLDRAAQQSSDLALPDGAVVSLRLIRARTDCRAIVQAQELTGLEVTCRLTAQVAQSTRPLTREELAEVCLRLGEQEKERLTRTVELAQYWDADFLELESRARRASPGQAARIQEQWPACFRSLDLEVDVQCTVERTFGMTQ